MDGYVDCFPAPPEPLVRELDVDRVNWILGTDIDGDTMRNILRELGFGVEGNTVTVRAGVSTSTRSTRRTTLQRKSRAYTASTTSPAR